MLRASSLASPARSLLHTELGEDASARARVASAEDHPRLAPTPTRPPARPSILPRRDPRSPPSASQRPVDAHHGEARMDRDTGAASPWSAAPPARSTDGRSRPRRPARSQQRHVLPAVRRIEQRRGGVASRQRRAGVAADVPLGDQPPRPARHALASAGRRSRGATHASPPRTGRPEAAAREPPAACAAEQQPTTSVGSPVASTWASALGAAPAVAQVVERRAARQRGAPGALATAPPSRGARPVAARPPSSA